MSEFLDHLKDEQFRVLRLDVRGQYVEESPVLQGWDLQVVEGGNLARMATLEELEQIQEMQAKALQESFRPLDSLSLEDLVSHESDLGLSFPGEGLSDFIQRMPVEAQWHLLVWVFAFFIVGFFCGTVFWAWMDLRAEERRSKGRKGRLKLPCHAWLAVLPMVSPAWLLPALLALVAVLVVGMGRGLKAEMGKVERRDGDGDGALGTTRPTLYFTGGNPL